MNISPQQTEMLRQARQRAEKLLGDLLRQQAEIEQSPPKLEPGQLAQGRMAMQKAIESARRCLDNLDDALKPVNDQQP